MKAPVAHLAHWAVYEGEEKRDLRTHHDIFHSSMKALPPVCLPVNRTGRQGRERNGDFTQVKLTLRSSMKALHHPLHSLVPL